MKLLFDIEDPIGVDQALFIFISETRTVFENDMISISSLASHYLSISKFDWYVKQYPVSESIIANAIVSGILSHLAYDNQLQVWNMLIAFYHHVKARYTISWKYGMDLLIEKHHMRQQ